MDESGVPPWPIGSRQALQLDCTIGIASLELKILVILFMVFIAGSLLSAGYFLVRDRGQSDRTVRALTVRIVLSICVFALLMLGYYLGLIGGRLS
jgi:hypothetical protein